MEQILGLPILVAQDMTSNFPLIDYSKLIITGFSAQ